MNVFWRRLRLERNMHQDAAAIYYCILLLYIIYYWVDLLTNTNLRIGISYTFLLQQNNLVIIFKLTILSAYIIESDYLACSL